MSTKTMATLWSNGTSGCLLLALFLTSCLSICDGRLTKSVRVSTDDNTTRPETTIPQGTVRGINMVTYYNRTIFGFMGIPYAQPPVGELRFKTPVPANGWYETFDAGSESNLCPQFDDQGEIAGDEDCLYLNVYTPQLPASDNLTRLPVMVFIVGGAFKAENNSLSRYSPDFLLDKDVVLVLPSFRVGILGFLTTGDEVAPGNYGLKDIVQALKWVQDSIEHFGGDPNQVTLLGGSSGGTSVHLLALSNLTNGLIHKYITESGTALSGLVNTPKEVCANRTIRLGKHLGCPTNSSTLLIDCLRDFNASRLVDTNPLFSISYTIPINAWTPTSEPDIEGAFLTDTPANLIAAGKIRDLPWIASVNSVEGFVTTSRYYKNPELFDDFLDNIDLVLPTLLKYQHVVDDVTAHTTALKSYYLKDFTADRSLVVTFSKRVVQERVSQQEMQILQIFQRKTLLANFTKLVGDALFIYPTYKAIQKQLVLAENPQYFCSFEYRGTFSRSYLVSGDSTDYGAVHGDELIYLFNDHEVRYGPADSEYSAADLTIMNTMVQLWTSFATNSTPIMTDSGNNTVWAPYSSLNNYLRIGNESDTQLEMKYDLYIERMKFWDELTAATSGEF